MTIGNQQVVQFSFTYGLVYVPKSIDPGKLCSALFFLHGAGEGGDGVDGLNTLLKQGLPYIIANDPNFTSDVINPKTGEKEQFIIISPQAPAVAQWSYDFGHVMKLLPEVMMKYPIDPNKIHITGLSAGAAGAISVGTHGEEIAKKFATMVLVSTAGTNSPPVEEKEFANIGKYGIKVWSICGSADSHITEAKKQAEGINAGVPGAAIISIIQGAGHDQNAWNPPYRPDWKNNPANQVKQSIFEFMAVNSRTDALSGSAPVPGTWSKLVGENQAFVLTAPAKVRYGANNKYIEKTLAAGTYVADNGTFGGDPISGVVKFVERYNELKIIPMTPEAPITTTTTAVPAATAKRKLIAITLEFDNGDKERTEVKTT